MKFSTYTRDSATVLDYADQRYYASTYGRFLTPDRYRPSADLKVPQSWNKYGYVQGEPINSTDPTGLIERVPDPGCDPTDPDPDPDPFCQPDPGPAPPPDPPSLPDPLCSISLWERPTPSGGPAKGLGEQTYILVTESDWAPFYPNGLMIEGGPVHHKLTGEINQPGQGLAAGKWNASDPSSRVNTEVGVETGRGVICDDIINLLNAVANYNSGPKVAYTFLSAFSYNSNAFTFTLLWDIGMGLGHPPGFTPGWGQFVPGLVVP